MEFTRPDSVQPLVEALRDPEVGLVAPRYARPDGTLQPAAPAFRATLGALILGLGLHHLMPDRLGRLAPQHWSHSASREVDWAMGAVIGIRTALCGTSAATGRTCTARRPIWPGVPSPWAAHPLRAGVGRNARGQLLQPPALVRPGREARVARSELVFLQTHYGPARRGLIRAIVVCTFAARVPILRLLGRTERAREYSAMARVYAMGA